MSVLSSRPCPVCADRVVEHLHSQRFALEEGHPLLNGYHVANCLKCGFVFADTPATQADYNHFYAQFSKYDDPATSTGSGASPFDKARLETTAEILSRIVPNTSARILDIGCAGGGLLLALQNRGYRNLVGVDPSLACAGLTREKIGEAHWGWVTSLPGGIGTFDCIVLSHVLEHVLDVAEALAALRPLLREGGKVYIEVPDAARYADYIYAPFQDFNTEHINHFSRVSLDNAMARHGYSVTGGGERLLNSSPQTFTPAVYGVYTPTNAHPYIHPDRNLRLAISRYIERSSALWNQIDCRIREALVASPELIVWGTGQLTLKLLAETELSQGRIAAFVDSNPIHHGRELCGAPILPPGALRSYKQPILVGTLLHHTQILAQIKEMGLSNPVILLPEVGPLGANALKTELAA
jgi:SAM-dependent methyltransferase